MALHKCLSITLAAGWLLSGCATAPDANLNERAAAAVRIYEPGETTLIKYRVVERIWVQTPRTLYWMPGTRTREEAIAALQREAYRKGADGIIYLSCLDQKTFWKREPSYLCYANAIKLE